MCCAARLPRAARISALKKRMLAAEVRGHLSMLVSLACHCLHSREGEAVQAWLPRVASCAREAAVWHRHLEDAPVQSALLLVGDTLRSGGQMEQGLHVYFCLADKWAMWPQFDRVQSNPFRLQDMRY
jgi:hypothetical protein